MIIFPRIPCSGASTDLRSHVVLDRLASNCLSTPTGLFSGLRCYSHPVYRSCLLRTAFTVFASSVRFPLPAGGLYLLATLASLPASGQDDFFSDIEIELESETATETGSDVESGIGFSLLGWVEQKVAYGLEAPGPAFSRQKSELTRVETSTYLQIDRPLGERSQVRLSGKAYHDEIYRINDSTPYTFAEINEHRNRFEIRDFYIEHQAENGIYIKAGHQILAWGMSEYLRVTDLINVENQYQLGQQDLEDLRLQVPALLTSVSAGGWTWDAVLTYHAGRDDIAPRRDEFDLFAPLYEAGGTISIRRPERDYEFFMRGSTQYAHGDIQIVAGEFNDNALALERVVLNGEQPVAQLYQNRMRALGVAANRVSGSWLVFGELGWHANRVARPTERSVAFDPDGWVKKDQLLGVLGVEYSGFRNLLLTAEIDAQRIRDNEPFGYGDGKLVSVGLRARWSALNERLQVLGVVNELAEDQGRVARTTVTYDWSDSLNLGLMWVAYSAPDNSLVNPFRHNDVLQLQLRYSFQSP